MKEYKKFGLAASFPPPDWSVLLVRNSTNWHIGQCDEPIYSSRRRKRVEIMQEKLILQLWFCRTVLQERRRRHLRR